MVDIEKWFRCNEKNPRKKGEYILMVSKKSCIGNWCNLYMFNAFWNGHRWDIPEAYQPIKWKYFRIKDQEKYGSTKIMEGV